MNHSVPLGILVLHNSDYLNLSLEAPGFQACRDVESSARDVAAALAQRGHRVSVLGLDGPGIQSLVALLVDEPPDLVFNLCESMCADARHEVAIPALLDLLGVPYTGSGPLGLGLALRKDRAKTLLRERGVPTPSGVVMSTPDAECVLPYPLIVKPIREDASVGISSASVVFNRMELTAAVAAVIDELHQPALVEAFIEGRELYVSLLGNAPPAVLSMHEIDFSELPAGLPRIVSYSGKWDANSIEFRGTRPVRCALDEALRCRVEQIARASFDALDLFDYGRVDLRLAPDGTPYVIDVNPNCDLASEAGFSRAAAQSGIDYPSLIEAVCEAALERHRAKIAARGASAPKAAFRVDSNDRAAISSRRPRTRVHESREASTRGSALVHDSLRE